MKTFLAIMFVLVFALSVVPSGSGVVAVGEFMLDVPYASQVPLGEWNDPRQKDGCEEASILMAMMWAQGTRYSPHEIRQQIVGMSDFEQRFYGFFHDSSAHDTARLMQEYFAYDNVSVSYNITTADIKMALVHNSVVIVPLNPRVLSTTLYNRATTRHTVVVIGYDDLKGEIIFHDPLLGGDGYHRAPEARFNTALGDYASGPHLPTGDRQSAMIVVGK